MRVSEWSKRLLTYYPLTGTFSRSFFWKMSLWRFTVIRWLCPWHPRSLVVELVVVTTSFTTLFLLSCFRYTSKKGNNTKATITENQLNIPSSHSLRKRKQITSSLFQSNLPDPPSDNTTNHPSCLFPNVSSRSVRFCTPPYISPIYYHFHFSHSCILSYGVTVYHCFVNKDWQEYPKTTGNGASNGRSCTWNNSFS